MDLHLQCLQLSREQNGAGWLKSWAGTQQTCLTVVAHLYLGLDLRIPGLGPLPWIGLSEGQGQK